MQQISAYAIPGLKIKQPMVPENSQEVMNSIEQITCDHFNVPQHKWKTKSRKREIVLTRQVVCFFYKKYTKLSLKEIGKRISEPEVKPKDHTTVIHSINTVLDIMHTDEDFKDDVENINKKIRETFYLKGI